MTTTSAQEKAQEAASTAAEEGRHVADVAKEEVQNVAGEAAAQARNVVDETMTQVGSQLTDQTREQRDRLVGTLQTFSDDLEKLTNADEMPGLATDLVREVAQRTRTLGSALENREPQELLEEVRRFARRRPGTFLLGALAAGMVVGRLARGAKQGSSSGSAPGSGGSGPTSASPAPPAPPAPPASPPPPQHEVLSGGHGQPTLEPQEADAASESGLGTEAAGYGQRGTTPGGAG
jgi:hypothetical protein